MPRLVDRLSARTAQTVKNPGMYADGKGLYLRIGLTGSKSWVYRYQADGRRHDLGLGPYPDVSVAEARERASAQRRLRLDGEDPLTARRTGRHRASLEAAKAITFREAAEQYIRSHEAGWRNATHAAQWPASLSKYVYPTIGDLPVAGIDTGLVLRVLEPIWTTKAETASRIRGRIESVLDWTMAREYRSGENPARWRGHLQNLLPQPSKVRRVEHHAALPYQQMAKFMTELRQHDGSTALALQFAILTAARTGEVVGARWEEIDFGERLWTIPASRIKAGREHRVPLSDAAIAVLDRMRQVRRGDYVFPGRDSNSPVNTAGLFHTLRRLNWPDVTVHGFRSTFRDWAAERTNYPAEVAEMALAHTVGSAVEQAYRRSDLFDRRRRLMDDWARWCSTEAAEPSGTVVAIGAVEALLRRDLSL